jgi:acyl-CoA synthetase (NDP forming)
VAVPADQVPGVVADAAAGGVHGLVVVSAGFAETGPDGAAEEHELVRQVHGAGMRLVGPNCLGIANTDPAVCLNATPAPRLPAGGRVGFFSQSGALGVALLAEADRRRLGLSTFVSAGNRADVSGNNLLQYWEDDPATDVILLYLESFGNPRKFARLARRVSPHKPIAAVASPNRAGNGLEPAAVSALFAHSGVIRVDTVAELFDVGQLLAGQPLPAGPRVGIVTNSSALGALAVSASGAAGLVVADGCLRDVGPKADVDAYAKALAATVADPDVDSVVVLFAPPLPGELADPGAEYAEAVAAASLSGHKPVVAMFLYGQAPVGVPAYPSVEEAVRALGRVSAYAAWRREPAGTVPPLPDVDVDAARAILGAPDPAADRLLAAYGISVEPSVVAESARAAQQAARTLGYPVALKAARLNVRHWVDLGAVRLNLANARAVGRAYADLAALFGPRVVVQRMVAPGVACVVDVLEDPAFGPLVGFGLAGVATELLGDRAFRAVPLTDRDAAALIEAPRAAPLLHGYRGAAPVAVDALAELLLRVGRLADDHPQVRALTLNPVLVRPDGWSVLHAAVTLGPPATRPDTGPRRL